MPTPLQIISPPGYLDEGLFGRLFLWIFDVLPYLDKHGIKPAWRIPSKLYGRYSDDIAIPGVVDLAYQHPAGALSDMSLVKLRNRHCYRLGFDWQKLSALWSSYFTVPDRVHALASRRGTDSRTLGIHFRGQDKQTSSWDSNEITAHDMLYIANFYLSQNSDLNRVFLATDQAEIVQIFKHGLTKPLLSVEVGEHHKSSRNNNDNEYKRSDMALADCVSLSQCGAVLQTSSALSAFSKILNPDLKIYRCAASKMLWDGPYFPVAYIPVISGSDVKLNEILTRTMADDWTHHDKALKFKSQFYAQPNWAWRNAALRRSLKRIIKSFGVKRSHVPVPFFYE